MRIKGMMYDVGRDLAGNEKYYEQLIERLAEYGYNMLMLNLEYRFNFPSHPEIGMPDGLTPEVICRLDRFARDRGIDLVPFMNCAGHCNGIGMTEKYNHLCADDMQSNAVEQLCINLPEAEQLIRDLFSDLYGCFSSEYFHLGGDEIRWLEKMYPDLEPDDRMREGVRFLNRIIDDVKAHGKIPMLWGDMLVRHPDVMDALDPEVIICDWSYFTSPELKQLPNQETLSFFRKAGRPTVFCNAASACFGNPIIADNSTMNIVYGSEEYLQMFGPDAPGIITTVWEIQFGGLFDVVWPWLYLQSRINAGEKRDFRSFDFLGEYTALEWGLPKGNQLLAKWHRLMDVEFSQLVLYEAFLDQRLRPALERNGNRPYKLMRWFYNSLFCNRNILPLLNTERGEWLTPYMLDKIEGIYRKALVLAEQMDALAVRRKEEARHLLQYNRVVLTVVRLLKLEAEFEASYHQAAKIQFADPEGYGENMLQLQRICQLMAENMDVLADWVDVLHRENNYAADACVMAPLAAADLRKRAENIGRIAASGASLVSYQRFIRRDADLPMIRHIGRDFTK